MSSSSVLAFISASREVVVFETTCAVNVLARDACFGQLEVTDDLFIGVSRSLHPLRSAEVDELCAIQLVRSDLTLLFTANHRSEV